MSRITTTYRGDMSFETVLGSHRLVIDVPASMGGKDRAPTPSELFVASIGSCVGAFVASYCERTGLDSRDMTVDVHFQRTQDPTRLTDLSVVVNLPHARCDAREEAIRRVAEHCPVHETIVTMPRIDFEIHDQATAAA